MRCWRVRPTACPPSSLSSGATSEVGTSRRRWCRRPSCWASSWGRRSQAARSMRSASGARSSSAPHSPPRRWRSSRGRRSCGWRARCWWRRGSDTASSRQGPMRQCWRGSRNAAAPLRSASSRPASASAASSPPASCPSFRSPGAGRRRSTSSPSSMPRPSGSRGSRAWTGRPDPCPALPDHPCATRSRRCSGIARRCCSRRTGSFASASSMRSSPS